MAAWVERIRQFGFMVRMVVTSIAWNIGSSVSVQISHPYDACKNRKYHPLTPRKLPLQE
jgi:hypothetical protein